MKQTRIIFLALSDIDDRIRALENKFQKSSAEFLQDKSSVPEDESLHWEAYLDQRRQLREQHRKTHSGYLDRVTKGKVSPRPNNTDLEVAA